MSARRNGTHRTPGHRRHQRRNRDREKAFLARRWPPAKVSPPRLLRPASAVAPSMTGAIAMPAFAAAWDEAWEIGTDQLEDLALKAPSRARSGCCWPCSRPAGPSAMQRSVVEHGGNLEVMLSHAAETLDHKLARLAGA